MARPNRKRRVAPVVKVNKDFRKMDASGNVIVPCALNSRKRIVGTVNGEVIRDRNGVAIPYKMLENHR
jgi:hypothetical protein